MWVRTLCRGELTIRGEGSKSSLMLFPAARASRYLKHGCEGLLANVIDTREEKKGTMAELLILCEFPYMFPEDLPGVSLKHQV